MTAKSVNNYLFNRYNRRRYEICSKLTIRKKIWKLTRNATNYNEQNLSI